MLNFTDNEIFAVEEYVGSKFEFINALLTDNVLLEADLNIGYGQLITNMEQLDSLMQLCIDLYTAILKFSIDNSNLINEVYRGVSISQFESLQKWNQLNKFLSTSTSFENILDSYGNPLYNRKFLRINMQNIPCLIVLDFYRQLWEQKKIDDQSYYSCVGESEAILLPFNKFTAIEQNELCEGTSIDGINVHGMPIYDFTLYPIDLEQLSNEEEQELYLRIASEIDEAKKAHDNYFKDKNHLNVEDLQRYINFKKLIIKYLKSKFAGIDLKFNYSRKNCVPVKNDGHGLKN